jgi:hypothetical protein
MIVGAFAGLAGRGDQKRRQEQSERPIEDPIAPFGAPEWGCRPCAMGLSGKSPEFLFQFRQRIPPIELAAQILRHGDFRL